MNSWLSSSVQKGLHALQKWGYERTKAWHLSHMVESFPAKDLYKVSMNHGLPYLYFGNLQHAQDFVAVHGGTLSSTSRLCLRNDIFELDFKGFASQWHARDWHFNQGRLSSDNVNTALKWHQHEPSIEGAVALLELAFECQRRDVVQAIFSTEWISATLVKERMMGNRVVRSYSDSSSVHKTRRELGVQLGMQNPYCLLWCLEQLPALRVDALRWHEWVLESKAGPAATFWPTTAQLLGVDLNVTHPRWFADKHEFQRKNRESVNGFALQLVHKHDRMYLAYYLDYMYRHNININQDEGYVYYPGIAQYQNVLRPYKSTPLEQTPDDIALVIARDMNIAPLAFFAMLNQHKGPSSPEDHVDIPELGFTAEL